MRISKKILHAIQPFLAEVRQGLEREALRTSPDGYLASTTHPRVFGSPLKHPYITLDFAEAQLEFTTPPLATESALLSNLNRIEAWADRLLGKEMMWPLSMPPILPTPGKIPLANFGSSAQAQKKMRYREGLRYRYGGAMQTISGIHYNFSLNDEFWKALAVAQGSILPLMEFRNQQYFALMRNVIRYVPVLTYLFGGSPAAHASFFRKAPRDHIKRQGEWYYGPSATSLRLSQYGYHNAGGRSIAVSYNSLAQYLTDLYHAIITPSKLWSGRGEDHLQLNTNILQLENEFYTAVRPKQKKHEHPGGSVVCSLACAGVEYVELRSVDIDPFQATGIGLKQLQFLRLFMTFCALAESPFFEPGEQQQWEDNQRIVALRGRDPKAQISTNTGTTLFSPWATQVCNAMKPMASILDTATHSQSYSRVWQEQFAKLRNSSHTPSAQIVNILKGNTKSFVDLGIALATEHRQALRHIPLSQTVHNNMRQMASNSLRDQAAQELHDQWILSGYEHLEQSTQVLIRAAQKRGIGVEVLDEETSIIHLVKERKEEFIKQATITQYDNYVSYEIMKDKRLTKLFLARAGIRVPVGSHFQSPDDAKRYYEQECDASRAVVVKPATTNYGTGVSIVGPRDGSSFTRAVKEAFRHDTTILVEEFIPGKEYRFLVIDQKVIGVLNRDPANVVGDGVHTIAELVRLKNTNPRNYKLPDYYIQLGSVERTMLKNQKLTPAAIVPKGGKVYLRKNSNVSDGGDPLDVTDQIPSAYKTIALKAAKAVLARITGVDMIIHNLRQSPNPTNHAIIEMNWNPTIYMHAFPVEGKPRPVGEAVLDFIGFK